MVRVRVRIRGKVRAVALLRLQLGYVLVSTLPCFQERMYFVVMRNMVQGYGHRFPCLQLQPSATVFSKRVVKHLSMEFVSTKTSVPSKPEIDPCFLNSHPSSVPDCGAIGSSNGTAASDPKSHHGADSIELIVSLRTWVGLV